MKAAMDRTEPCSTTIEAWLMKYAGRSEEQVNEMRGSFEEHCAARTVLSLRNAGAVFPDPSDKAFRAFKDSIINQQEKMPDGDAVDNNAPATSNMRHEESTGKL